MLIINCIFSIVFYLCRKIIFPIMYYTPIMKYTYTLFILLFFSVLTTQAQVTPTTTEGTQTETTVRNGIGRVGLEQPKSIVQQYTYNPIQAQVQLIKKRHSAICCQNCI